jgi:hypothetical protein
MSDAFFERETDEDPLDRLLREARAVAPPGLVARLAAGARDPEARKRLFWADIDRGARSLLGFAAAAAVLAVALATTAVLFVPAPDNARTASVVKSDELTLDQTARFVVSPAALEMLILGEDR